jgi:hypothetical protein
MDAATRRVYEWECDWRALGITTQATTRRIVRWACRKYGVSVPTIVFRAGIETSYMYCDPSGDCKLVLKTRQRDTLVILHEIAHHIDYCTPGMKRGDHNSRWLAIYVWLVEHCRLPKGRPIPRGAMRGSLRAYGCRFDPIWTVHPKRLRRRKHASAS